VGNKGVEGFISMETVSNICLGYVDRFSNYYRLSGYTST
jgi:hypothetical protein